MSMEPQWSAYFISYCVRTADDDAGFPYKANHNEYAQQIRNILNSPRRAHYGWELIDPRGKSLDILKLGDIVLCINPNSPRPYQTFDNNPWSGAGHADIVTNIQKQGNTVTRVTLTGGNLQVQGSGAVRTLTMQLGDGPRDFNLQKYPISPNAPAVVIIRSKYERVGNKIAAEARKEFNLWRSNSWINDTNPAAFERVQFYIRNSGVPGAGAAANILGPSRSGALPQTGNQANSGSPITSDISPYISTFESFHPKIQYELNTRRLSTSTVSSHMPFVKLTALMSVSGSDNLQSGVTDAWCPTLGVHDRDNVSFETIYYPSIENDTNRSIIGYATTKDERNSTAQQPVYKRVPVFVQESAEITDQNNIPIPGIVDAMVERNVAGPMGVRGGLLRANLKIMAYSIGQVDALLKYFMRPATRVVLEFGKASSDLPNDLKTFNWKQGKDIVKGTFTRLIDQGTIQTKFTEEYVYNNYGRYEIFLGYVVKFNLKYTKDNKYEIDLTIHSVQQYEIPTRHTGTRSLCAESTVNRCRVMDAEAYFNEAYSWMENSFVSLMTNLSKDRRLSKWLSHVITINDATNPQQPAAYRHVARDGEGNPLPTELRPNSNSIRAGLGQGGYFVSWEFFVNVILLDQQYGVLSVFNPRQGEDISLIKAALLKTVNNTISQSDPTKLVANEVGYHPQLRSTNPSIMIIYNNQVRQNYEFFQLMAEAQKAFSDITVGSDYITQRIISNQSVGAFKNRIGPNNKPGVGRLTDGVWINTNAIAQAFTSNDTISTAIEWLLTQMNNSTEGYWNLQLISNDTTNPGNHVIDSGISKKQDGLIPDETLDITKILDENTYKAGDPEASNKPKYIYAFNRKLSRVTGANDYFGSELLDVNIEYNLPHVIAAQAIAGVSGVAQKATLQAIDVPGLQKLSLIDNLYLVCPEDDRSGVDDRFPCSKEPRSVLDMPIDPTLQSQFEQERENALNQITQTFRARRLEIERKYGRTFIDPTSGQETVVDRFTNEQQQTAYTTEVQRLETQLQTEYLRVPSVADRVRRYNSQSPEQMARFLTQTNPKVVQLLREYGNLGTALSLIESNPSSMIKRLNLDSRDAERGVPNADVKAHAFSSSNLTKSLVNLTMPGIGGIELFQAFLVDRVPSIYKFGYYVVTKITHKFSPDKGWTTELEGRFNYRPPQVTESPVSTTTTAAPSAPSGAAGNVPGARTLQRRVLREGMSGEDVRYVQILLGVTPTGPKISRFGPQTKAAVIKFQTDKNLRSRNGVVGPETWPKLDELRGSGQGGTNVGNTTTTTTTTMAPTTTTTTTQAPG